jgi:hypothetical protein
MRRAGPSQAVWGDGPNSENQTPSQLQLLPTSIGITTPNSPYIKDQLKLLRAQDVYSYLVGSILAPKPREGVSMADVFWIKTLCPPEFLNNNNAYIAHYLHITTCVVLLCSINYLGYSNVCNACRLHQLGCSTHHTIMKIQGLCTQVCINWRRSRWEEQSPCAADRPTILDKSRRYSEYNSPIFSLSLGQAT